MPHTPAWTPTAPANARLTACLPVFLPSAASVRCARQVSAASSIQSASVPTASPGPRSPRRCHLPQPQLLRQPPPLSGPKPPSHNPKRRGDAWMGCSVRTLLHLPWLALVLGFRGIGNILLDLEIVLHSPSACSPLQVMRRKQGLGDDSAPWLDGCRPGARAASCVDPRSRAS